MVTVPAGWFDGTYMTVTSPDGRLFQVHPSLHPPYLRRTPYTFAAPPAPSRTPCAFAAPPQLRDTPDTFVTRPHLPDYTPLSGGRPQGSQPRLPVRSRVPRPRLPTVAGAPAPRRPRPPPRPASRLPRPPRPPISPVLVRNTAHHPRSTAHHRPAPPPHPASPLCASGGLRLAGGGGGHVQPSDQPARQPQPTPAAAAAAQDLLLVADRARAAAAAAVGRVEPVQTALRRRPVPPRPPSSFFVRTLLHAGKPTRGPPHTEMADGRAPQPGVIDSTPVISKSRHKSPRNCTAELSG